MAKFKCKNCGNRFESFCNSAEMADATKCPECESGWTEYIGNKNETIKEFEFPRLPYSDPVLPDDIGWPPNKRRYWCHGDSNNICDCALYSRVLTGL